MALVSSKEMLEDAQKNHYAVGAFNVENMEMVIAVVEAAEAMHAPVILQTTPGTLKYAGVEYFRALAGVAAGNASVPVVMHLDHGSSAALASRAYRAGYTSIMIDGSKAPLEENIRLTKEVVGQCAPGGVPVEGELGKVGGKEDDVEDTGPSLTDPEDAALFVDRTHVSSLAIGIGTAHGIYKGIPHIHAELVSRIRDAVSVPLVMHGTSGVPDDQVRECIQRGICKVNYATDLRIAYSRAVERFLDQYPDTIDPKKFNGAAICAIRECVCEKLRLVGSVNRA